MHFFLVKSFHFFLIVWQAGLMFKSCYLKRVMKWWWYSPGWNFYWFLIKLQLFFSSFNQFIHSSSIPLSFNLISGRWPNGKSCWLKIRFLHFFLPPSPNKRHKFCIQAIISFPCLLSWKWLDLNSWFTHENPLSLVWLVACDMGC